MAPTSWRSIAVSVFPKAESRKPKAKWRLLSAFRFPLYVPTLGDPPNCPRIVLNDRDPVASLRFSAKIPGQTGHFLLTPRERPS